MNLLGNVLYDPAVAVTKGAAASVLAVFDTTNARIAFVVPPSGMVRVVIQCVVHGAVTFSQIVLGCLEGATVRGRVVPVGSLNGTALATSAMTQMVDYVVSGLTPGASLTWDAAWGIETFVASSLIKYGGPNNTTANDAFGALIFQIWDPCPIYTPTSATAPTLTVHTKLDTIDDFVDTEVAAIKAKTDQLTFTTANRVDSQVFGIQANAITAAAVADGTIDAATFAAGAINAAAIADGAIDAATFTAGAINAAAIADGAIDAATFAAGAINAAAIAADAITDAKVAADVTIASVTGAVGSVTAMVDVTQAAADKVWGTAARALTDKVGFALTAAYDPAKTAAQAGDYTAVRAAKLDNLDVLLSTRLASSSYTAPDNTNIVAGALSAAAAAADSLTLVGRLTAPRAANLDNLNATISSRAIPGDAMALTAGERLSVADALLSRNVAGGSSAGRLVKEALAVLRNKITVVAGVLTVYDTDDVTPLFVATVSTAAGDPISAIDPA